MGQVRDTKFSTSVSNEMLLYAASVPGNDARVTDFSVSELSKEKQQWG